MELNCPTDRCHLGLNDFGLAATRGGDQSESEQNLFHSLEWGRENEVSSTQGEHRMPKVTDR